MEKEIVNELDKIVDSLKKLEIATENITNLSKKMLELGDSFTKLSSASAQLDPNDIMIYLQSFNTIVSAMKNVNDLTIIIGNFGGVLSSFVGSLGASTGAVGALSTAFNFLALNPVVAVIGAIGLVVGALAIFDTANEESTEKTDQTSDAIKRQGEELGELNEQLSETFKTSKDRVISIMTEYDQLAKSVEKLQEMSKDGKSIENIEEAKHYIDQINGILPNSISLTEGNKIQWIKTAEEIQKNIDLIKQKAIVEQQMEKNKEIFAKELEIKREFSTAQTRLNGALAEYTDLKQRENSLSTEEKERYEELKNTIPTLQENYDKAAISMGTLEKATKETMLSTQALSGTARDKGREMAELWTQLEENGSVSFDSLGVALSEFNIKYGELSNSNNEHTRKEAEQYKVAADIIKNSMIEKAFEYGLSYDKMIASAEEKGVKLTEVDKKQLKEMYDTHNLSWEKILTDQLINGDQRVLNEQLMFSNLSSLQKGEFLNAYNLFKESGNTQGMIYLARLAGHLKENGGVLGENMSELVGDIESEADKSNAQVKVNLAKKGILEDINKVRREAGFEEIADIDVKFASSGKGIRIAGFYIPIEIIPYAKGGFPDTGELFVAREAGPELVGRINGKTAVANNDQIVSGISSGVYNAVRSAMSGNGGNGNMNIHATFVMDGDVVGKQVIKYHNGVVKRTGTTPLMI